MVAVSVPIGVAVSVAVSVAVGVAVGEGQQQIRVLHESPGDHRVANTDAYLVAENSARQAQLYLESVQERQR